ncbi:hypothetical protein PWY87_06500 [Kribbella solani]|uniref:hypothetical protein n=1 Tax=Kribbella solani TaxID=236067 RepID=UPI0029A61410|nr:hypothetical protein [Kribbella solani]MDX2968930.1 hypothetical protein [Kribbella solani]MDX3001309.1 hypothetical protein [Kribbella solani]
MARKVHQSGDPKRGDGGYSDEQSKALKAALDGVSTGTGKSKDDDKGEKPQTGALRDIGSALNPER